MPMPQNDFENGIKIEFWIDDHIHAIRYSLIAPVIGDEVRFNGVPYKVHYRIFIYDEPAPRIAVNMEAVEQSVQADVAKALSEKTVVAKFKKGKLVSERVIAPAAQLRPFRRLSPKRK